MVKYLHIYQALDTLYQRPSREWFKNFSVSMNWTRTREEEKDSQCFKQNYRFKFINRFHDAVLFLCPLKTSERRFLMFSGGIERDQQYEMGSYKLHKRHVSQSLYTFIAQSQHSMLINYYSIQPFIKVVIIINCKSTLSYTQILYFQKCLGQKTA